MEEEVIDIDISTSVNKIVAVSPIIKRTEALELTDPELPGEITVDKHGKLLKTWFEMEGKIGSLIETYDNWVVNILKKQLASRKLKIPQGEVTVMNPMFFLPRISSSNNSWTPLTPRMARDNGYTYASELYVDLVLNRGTKQEEKLSQVFFGKFPVMLGSALCHLRGKTDKERAELGECANDPLGYFIIKGTEQVILIQEKLRVNRILLYNSTSKGDTVCKITSSTIRGSSNVVLVKNKQTEALEIHLAFMGRSSEGKTDKVGNTVSVFQIYRMLGINNPNKILEMISMFTKKEYIKKIWVQLQPTFVRLAQIGDDIEYISKKKGLGDLDYGIRKSQIIKDLKNELFTHIPPDNIEQKLYMLSIMVARMSEYLIGVRKLDDRDNWANKRLESAGRSLEQLFGNIWREVVTRAQDSIDTKGLQGLQSVRREIDPSFIADNFVSSFTANNWGVQGSYMPKENITDILKRDSLISVYSHLTKVNTPTGRKGKQVRIRLVQMSQLGFVCPIESPEGEQCVTGDTTVLVGTYNRFINELQNGDAVITVSPTDLQETRSKIKNYFRKIPDELLEIKTISGRSIKCTPNHPFLVNKNGDHFWVNAGDLNVNDKVVIKGDEGGMFAEYMKYLWSHHDPMEYDEFEKLEYDEFEKYKDLNGKFALPIESITNISPEPVYDFETEHSNHSFIANGFVTHNCGLVKNIAITNYISLERGEDVILEHIRKYISRVPTEQLPTPLMLNGKFMGWCAGESLKNFCVALRRRLVFYKDTSIVLAYDGFLYIYTDAARPTRPLLIVDPTNGELVIKNKGLWNADMKTLLEEGCVEYIDAFEQEYIQLAQTMDDIDSRKVEIEEAVRNHQEAIERLAELEKQKNDPNKQAKKLEMDIVMTINDAKETISQAANTLKDLQELPPYTHSELDPTAIFGLAASVIPLPNHNQGPRNTYECVPTTCAVLRPSFVRSQIGSLKDLDTVITIDPVTLKMSETKIHSHFIVDSRKTNKKMVEIRTHSGRTIQATKDHKFLTLNGWVEAGNLNPSKHHLALYPSVKYLSDERTDRIIVDIDTAKSKLISSGIKDSLVKSHLCELKQLNLMPLRMNNPHLPIIARILGYTQADGHVGLKKDTLRTRMTFGREYDAELFSKDVDDLGFPPNKEVYNSFYKDDGVGEKEVRHVWVIERTGSFGSLLVILDAVLGRKTYESSNPIPPWIMKGSDLIKREYIAGFMGGYGCKINVSHRQLSHRQLSHRQLSHRQYLTRRRATYDMGSIVQHKHKEHINSLLGWFKQFRSLLKHFKININRLRHTLAYENKYRFELEISSERNNLIRYMDTIGYRYATTQTSNSLKVVEWLKYVNKALAVRRELRKKIHDLHYKHGYTHPKLSKIFNISVQQSQDHCKGYRKEADVNLPNDAIKLEEWLKFVIVHNDCIFVPIEIIKETEGCMVSDFTTESSTHSFVAGDGFITHNCKMGEQALGVYHSQHSTRFDTTAKCLAYPSRPLFETQMNEVLGLNELPAGDTVIVAIMSFTGYNQEDAIIMNKASIDRGLFRQVVYKSYKTVQKRTRYTVEEFTRPEVRANEPPERYAAIDEKGIARLGSFVRESDCVIGKIRKNITTGKVENASIYVGVGQEGIVDRVLVASNAEGMRVVKVKIRQIRRPILGDKYASRYAQKATVGLILPQEDMPYSISGVVPDIIINPHCFPGDTPVSTGFGYSRRIDSFSPIGGECVWGWSEKKRSLEISTCMGMEPKGVKKLIKLYLEDGRVIKCTPDHRFLTVRTVNGVPEYNWVQAKNTIHTNIVAGLYMPLDEPEMDMKSGWSLKTVEYTFDLKTLPNREKSLAFGRIVGMVFTDRCISQRRDCGFVSTVYLGHKIDATFFIRDIYMITGIKPEPTFSKGVWCVRVPSSLARSIGKLEGVQGKTSQNTTWPSFIMKDDCPLSVIREFLAALFGGDGHSPRIIDRSGIPGGFSQTTMEQYIPALKVKISNISLLLSRLGVSSKVEGPFKVRYGKPGYKPSDGIDRYGKTGYKLKLEANTDFSDNIGFRYCIQKSCRSSAAASYWRFQQRVREQHDWVIDRTNEIYESARGRTDKKSLSIALGIARKELKDREPILNEHYSLSNMNDVRNRKTLSRFEYIHFPDIKEFLTKIGCLNWFARETKSRETKSRETKSRETKSREIKSPSYKRGSGVPGFHLKVVGIRDGGEEMVYDIGVDNIHSFLANGLTAHNCIPSRMTMGKLIEIVASKFASFEGERINATAFRKFNIREFKENLRQYGYSPSGKERLFSGYTGKPFEAEIFIGPCYYQALRHHVADKIQMRSRGAIKQLSHQPTGGRARKGGQRLGEMERDAIISHGASEFLRERLCTVSDAYTPVYCSTCGTIAIANYAEDKFICRTCGDNAKFGTCTIPYSYKLLTHMLAGAGFNLTFEMSEINKK